MERPQEPEPELPPREDVAPEPEAAPEADMAPEPEAAPDTGWEAEPEADMAPEPEAAPDTGWEAEPAVEAAPEPETLGRTEGEGWGAGEAAAAEVGGEGFAMPEAPVEEPSVEAVEVEGGAEGALDAEPEPEITHPLVEEPTDWVIETEEEEDRESLDVTPVGTVEETAEEAGAEVEEESASWVSTPDEESASVEEQPAESFFGGSAAEPTAVEEPPAGEATFEMEPEPPEPEPPVQAFTFGQRDPHDKARRLARVLVSDMIMYNAERHMKALEAGTLKEDFEDEIEKSWKEYVEQVGDEIAGSTTYWTEALNDVLAKGDQIFG